MLMKAGNKRRRSRAEILAEREEQERRQQAEIARIKEVASLKTKLELAT